MKISFDNIHVIGKEHKVCQDYTYSDENILIVCDGCSSSKNSEIGAMLITQFLKAEYYKNRVSISVPSLALRLSAEVLKQLDVPIEALDCTVLMAERLENNIGIYMYGDGAVFIKNKNGISHCNYKEYSSSAPNYLSYELIENLNRKSEYDRLSSEGNHTLKTSFLIDENGEGERQCSYVNHYNSKTYFEEPIENLEYIILSTDGILSLTNKQGTKENYFKENWKSIVDFKSTNGEFLKRRINKLKSNWEKENIIHSDDIGMAGFYFNHEVK